MVNVSFDDRGNFLAVIRTDISRDPSLERERDVLDRAVCTEDRYFDCFEILEMLFFCDALSFKNSYRVIVIESSTRYPITLMHGLFNRYPGR